MPVREYRCVSCGHRTERLERSASGTSPSPHLCPSCQKDTLERMLSAPHYNLKGTGWYKPGMTR